MELRQAVLAYLQQHNCLTLATNGPDGPWAAAVFYVNLEYNLYFLSEKKTRHAQDLAYQSRVAATINQDYNDWRQIRGIQLAGEAAIIVGVEEKARAMAAYTAKFPFVQSFFLSPKFYPLMLRTKLYRLRPEKIYLLDNSRGFSHREELHLG